jgi:hypothetical protein
MKGTATGRPAPKCHYHPTLPMVEATEIITYRSVAKNRRPPMNRHASGKRPARPNPHHQKLRRFYRCPVEGCPAVAIMPGEFSERVPLDADPPECSSREVGYW